jgi:hypothetical protein
MAQDDFVICEVVVGVAFCVIFVTIVGVGIYNCLQRKARMAMLQNQCDEVEAMTAEQQLKLKWITGVTNLADNESLFTDDFTSNASFNSRKSQL